MINVGSTMTTEAWDEYYKPNLTWNHAWGTAPANIIPRKLMGIEPLQPAFRKFRIKPQPNGIKKAFIKMPTIRGTIKVNWAANDSLFSLSITVPANSRAEVWLPAATGSVREQNSRISEMADIKSLGRKDGFSVYEIPAGYFNFSGRLR